MSNIHRHWHFHPAGRYHSSYEERHEGGWHEHIHQHLHRVSDELINYGHPHLDGPHGHDHIFGEDTIRPDAPQDLQP